MTTVEEQETKTHAELLVVYQVSTEDLEHAKQWGWQVAYQTVLAQLGLAALRQAYPADAVGVDFLLVLTIFAITLVSVTYVNHSQQSIDKFRARLRRCREQFQKQTCNVLGPPDLKRPWPLAILVSVSGALAIALVLVPGRLGSGP